MKRQSTWVHEYVSLLEIDHDKYCYSQGSKGQSIPDVIHEANVFHVSLK